MRFDGLKVLKGLFHDEYVWLLWARNLGFWVHQENQPVHYLLVNLAVEGYLLLGRLLRWLFPFDLFFLPYLWSLLIGGFYQNWLHSVERLSSFSFFSLVNIINDALIAYLEKETQEFVVQTHFVNVFHTFHRFQPDFPLVNDFSYFPKSFQYGFNQGHRIHIDSQFFDEYLMQLFQSCQSAIPNFPYKPFNNFHHNGLVFWIINVQDFVNDFIPWSDVTWNNIL